MVISQEKKEGGLEGTRLMVGKLQQQQHKEDAMTRGRMKELLNEVIESEMVGRDIDEAIKVLLFKGFKAEELYDEFDFDKEDVLKAQKEYENK